MKITDNSIIDEASDFDWLNDDDGSKMIEFIKTCEAEGFSKIPDDHPVGIEGYEYRFHGPLAYYRQIPK